MKLFVGLGNPGEKYSGNRHNVGFMAVDRIAGRHGFSAWRKKFQGLIADGTLAGEKVLLIKPQTYMNDSGHSVVQAAGFYKIPESEVVVFYDEIDLAPGKLRAKTGGGNAGHNGLKSITAHLGNEYQRVRIGVGHPGRKDLVADYVLHDFAKADQVWLEPLLDAITDAAPLLATGEQARFLTDIGQKLKQESGDAQPATTAAEQPQKPPRKPPIEPHPAGGRMAQRRNALTENLEKWLKRTKRDG